ncbi:MAG: hypothetical protein Fues2KO_02490 [Fuerstiella sp.]
MNASRDDEQLQDRLTRIEAAIAHLQHDVDELNQSLTRHYQRLQSFDARFQRIEHEIETMAEGPEERDLDSEKPPHY